ncbi:MAG: S-adenosylmethionine decarboxylase [Myxococcales bacterium]
MTAHAFRLRAPRPARAWNHLLATLEAPSPAHAGFAPDRLLQEVRGALADAGLLAPGEHAHRFEPQGFSFLGFGPEVRLALHTWPEHGLATLDLYAPDGGEALVASLVRRLGWRVREQRAHPRTTGETR